MGIGWLYIIHGAIDVDGSFTGLIRPVGVDGTYVQKKGPLT